MDEELGLYVVADGMGGRAAGEVASRMAVASIRDAVTAQRGILADYARGAAASHEVTAVVSGAVQGASRAVLRASQDKLDRQGMGTTVTAMVLTGHRAFVAHVGDSRLYLVRDGIARQLSRDHTLLDELVLAGHMTRAEADSAEMQRLKNVLARAVGVQAEILVDTFEFDLVAGDRVLLCSDGLTHYFEPWEIAQIAAGDSEVAVSEFVRITNERGGHDNVTVVVIECDGPDVPQPEAFAERRRAIEAAGVLAGLDPRLSFHLALSAETHEVPTGAVITREDQPVQALHIVVDGAVRLARRGGSEKECGPGASFGETSLVDRWAEAPTVVAARPTRYVRITREAILAVGRREPEVHEQILAGFARAVTSKVRPAAAPR